MKGTLRFGSHLPVLIKLVQMTDGPILELGSGYASTPFLHWACFDSKRKLVTYENKGKFYDMFRKFGNEYHSVHNVTDWDKIDISGPWSVVLVDHSPGLQRVKDVKKLVHADYLILHDADNAHDREYKYSTARHLFKYRYKYNKIKPFTAIWSNKFEVKDIMNV